MRKLTQEEFIAKCIDAHGDKYDYSEAVYTRAKDQVKLTCNTCKHVFHQVAYHHTSGSGCPKCAQKKNGERIAGIWKDIPKETLGLEGFIERANKRYDNKYDYSKAVYVNMNTHVTIICPKHKEFRQTPLTHLNMEYGCPKCAYEIVAKKNKLTTEEFIRRANKTHNNRYSYENAVYLGAQHKVTITCPNPEHGDFDQRANVHIHGQGCPKCANENKRSASSCIEHERVPLKDERTFPIK